MPLLQRLNKPIVAIVAVTALGGFLRFFHLQHPPEFVFDEVYYPKAGCILLGWSNQVCHIDSGDEKYWRAQKWDVGSWVHPPLGKWQIAMGIKAFGMNPFGWRVTSALAGTLVVALTAIIAQLLFGSALWTFVAGALIAVEDLNVVMSRTALLDVHLELWVVVGFLLVLLDRRWLQRRQAPDPPPDPDPPPEPAAESGGEPAAALGPIYSPLWRPWRFAAGAAFGAAAAVKWSGAMAIVAAVIIAYMWESSRRHRGELSWAGAIWRAFARESFGIVLALFLVPLAVYMLVWIPWFHHFGWSWGAWWENFTASIRFHEHGLQWTALDPKTGLQTPTHPYYARQWRWFLDIRPTSFYVKDFGPDIEQVLAIGHPFIFWANVIAIPFLAVAWRRVRDWRAGFIFVAFVGQYVLWFVVTRPTFFFYVLPLTPFMVLAVTYLCRQLSDATIVVRDPETGDVATNPETGTPAISHAFVYRPFVWAYLLAVLLASAWFWPILTAGRITDIHWRTIVWFNVWI